MRYRAPESAKRPPQAAGPLNCGRRKKGFWSFCEQRASIAISLDPALLGPCARNARYLKAKRISRLASRFDTSHEGPITTYIVLIMRRLNTKKHRHLRSLRQ